MPILSFILKNCDGKSSVCRLYRESSIWWKLFIRVLHEDHSQVVRRRHFAEALPFNCVISCKSEILRWKRVQAPLGTIVSMGAFFQYKLQAKEI